MELKITSPSYHKTIQVESITAETDVGSFIIQKGHAPILLALAPTKAISWEIVGTEPAVETLLLPLGGLLHSTRTCATLIIYE